MYKSIFTSYRFFIVIIFLATLSPRNSVCCGATPAGNDSFISPLIEGYIERADKMMSEKNFAGVVDQIEFIRNQGLQLSHVEKEEIDFLYGKALYERGDYRCVAALENFISSFPKSSKSVDARLLVGDYYFFSKDYGKALTEYLDTDYFALDRKRQQLYDYRKGLCMIKTGLYEDAENIFSGLENISGYEMVSQYYLAYIDYARGNYEDAYESFEKIAARLGEDRIEGITPLYYMTQIDYRKELYRKVVEEGEELLADNYAPELENETRRIVGLSLFKLGEYERSKEVLQEYVNSSETYVAPDALYSLGVIYYKEEDYNAAADIMLPLADEENEIGQSASLFLGQIAVKEMDADGAAIYFEKAAKMNYDRDVSEAALYNYIVARTRGGNVPFSSSIPLLTEYLDNYSDSEHAAEVEAYMAEAYYNEKNYQKALESINRIERPNNMMLEAKQKILYELGVEAMVDKNPRLAKRYFTEALPLSSNTLVKSLIYLWLGDANYALADYPAASANFKSYLNSDADKSNRALAYYDLAYSELMQTHYGEASKYYDSALKASPALKKTLYDDALLRLADTKYYTGNYNAALKDYSSAIAAGAAESDYAVYRRAVMYGLAGNIKTKLRELEEMPAKYPGSKWLPAALLEVANTYSGLSDTKNATKSFEELRTRYGGTPEARSGMLDLAISYMENGNEKKGEETYREIIMKWPTSSEANVADADLRKYYSEKGALAQYVEFLGNIPGAPAIDGAEMEKLSYEAAEKKALADNPDITLLEAYIKDYPDGPNIPKALLIKATVLEERGIKNYPQALKVYKELEKRGGIEYAPMAYAGIMRTTSSPEEKLKYASLVKGSPGLPADIVEEARLIEAIALLDNGKQSDAIAVLTDLALNPVSESGAHAAVILGEYYLKKGKYDQAEKVLKEFTDVGTPQQYWLARGFIALADVYHAKKRDYLAVEYLKSLKENYPGNELDIQDMIETRLKKWQN